MPGAHEHMGVVSRLIKLLIVNDSHHSNMIGQLILIANFIADLSRYM